MEPPETNLARALRQLAVALAEAQDRGADQDDMALRFGAEASAARDPALVGDALLAAGLLLAGSDPHLPLLTGVWGTAELRDVVEELAQALRRAP